MEGGNQMTLYEQSRQTDDRMADARLATEGTKGEGMRADMHQVKTDEHCTKGRTSMPNKLNSKGEREKREKERDREKERKRKRKRESVCVCVYARVRVRR